MKKTVLSAAAVIAAMGALSISAYADAEVAEVKVTVCPGTGNVPVVYEDINVGDADGDGAITVNDALITVHNEKFEGGADAGYATAEGDYGAMITKLWGIENGGAYGYYINNNMAYALTDPLNDGDRLNAYVYSDAVGYSDVYCFFGNGDTEIDASPDDEPLQLTLSGIGFDESWNTVVVPIVGAEITVDAIPTGFVTDDEGKVEIPLSAFEDGVHLISAMSETQTLVPPAFELTFHDAVIDEPDTAPDAAAPDAQAPVTGDVAAAADSSKGSPDTGVADVAAVAGIAVVAAGALLVSRKRK